MRIVKHSTEHEKVAIDKINIGDTFEYEGGVFLKTELVPVHGGAVGCVNAVCLASEGANHKAGFTYLFLPYHRLHPANYDLLMRNKL